MISLLEINESILYNLFLLIGVGTSIFSLP
jgi:hypothetical protein